MSKKDPKALLLNPELSIDLSRSNETDCRIKFIGETLKEVIKNSPFDRAPIIAGGAIRDMVHGTKVNDYDIFVDVSHLSKDEGEDAVLLLADDFLSLLKKKDHPLFRNSGLMSIIGGNPGGYEDSEFAQKGIFFNYKTAIADEMAPIPPGFWDSWFELQFIGHMDQRLTTDPMSFVNDFDYSLVKGFYDPTDEEYHFHDEFFESASSRIIRVANEKTLARVTSWSWSFPGYKGIETGGGPFPYTIEKAFKIYTSTLESIKWDIEVKPRHYFRPRPIEILQAFDPLERDFR